MIARVWRDRVVADMAAAYLERLKATGLAGYAATPGNRGVPYLQRTVDGVAEVQVVTFWDSLDEVRAFAGAAVDRAYYYPGDDEFLLDRPETVTHWEVLVDE